MTVCLSFLQTEMDKEQQIDMAETNQPPRTTMTIQRDAAGNNSTWLAPAWNGFLNAVKSVLKWLYIGIEWPKDINSDAFARRAVTASDSTCPTDGVSLALMSTLLLIPDSFCAGAKTIPDRASVHTDTNGDFGTISVKVMFSYTRRFATTTFSAAQRCNIVSTLFRMFAILFQHCNAVLR